MGYFWMKIRYIQYCMFWTESGVRVMLTTYTYKFLPDRAIKKLILIYWTVYWKGVWREIFDFRFIRWISAMEYLGARCTGPLSIPLQCCKYQIAYTWTWKLIKTSIYKCKVHSTKLLTKYEKLYLKIFIFYRRGRWHR